MSYEELYITAKKSFDNTVAFWGPEWLDDNDMINELIEKITDAIVDELKFQGMLEEIE